MQRPSTLRYVLAIAGYAATTEKLDNPKLVIEVVKKFGKLLRMSRNMSQPYCLKMTHNTDPQRSFIMSGIIAHSRSVFLDTFPGKKHLQLHIFSSRGLKGFQKTAEKVVCDTFGLTRYEMDIQELENLQQK